MCRRIVVSKSKQGGFWNFVIPAVAAVAGAALSSKSNKDAAQANVEAQRDANQLNYEAQKEFAQHGVSWRVADAKAAGLHPLYALGGGGASYSPSFQTAPAERGTDYSWLAQLGQLMGNYLGGQDKEAVARAQMRNAQQAAGGGQSMTITEYPGGGRTIVTPIQGLESQVSGMPLDAPMESNFGMVPRQLRTDPLGKSHIVEPPDKAGAFWQRFNFGDRFQVVLPKTSEPQEVFEDKPLWFWAMVAKANVKEFGPGWLHQARQQFPSLREVYDGVVQELKASGLWFGR